MALTNAVQGTVKWFDNAKGYGFINPIDDPDTDVFVHYRSIEPDKQGFKVLHESEQVEFKQVKSDKGWQAAEVIRLGETEASDSAASGNKLLGDFGLNLITPGDAYKKKVLGDGYSLKHYKKLAGQSGKCSACGTNDIWKIIDSGMCFPCTTGESDGSQDYELI